MPVETCHYRLSARGKPVGTHELSTSYRGRTALLGAKLMLQGKGPFRNVTITQQSKAHRDQFFSFSFQESSTASDTQTFSLDFSLEEGLVKATSGRDSASVPYIASYEDPLSLLYHLRHLGDETQLRVPMLGKDVVVERVGETMLETVLGERTARVYQLQPGGSYVYVDAAPPHPILMLTQRFDGQLLDALIVRVDENAEPPREAAPKRKRRRRRRKRK